MEAAARLSARYISGRQLPDKAVDLLDTAAARVKISVSSKPDYIDDRERQIKTLERELAAIQRDIEAETRIDDGRSAELEAEIAGIEKDLVGLNQRWEKERDAVTRVLDLRQQLARLRDPADEVAQTDEQEAEAESPEQRRPIRETDQAGAGSGHGGVGGDSG